MNEILKNQEIDNSSKELQENILKIENLFNENPEQNNYLSEETEKLAWNLNKLFWDLLKNWKTKDWNKYDFFAAMKAKVSKPIWVES